ncbi:MAG: toxin, partial [Candidatus Krumholzibacteria bacterium]|nr:toxin [Candidatus Krumholzibacteria bacterium]
TDVFWRSISKDNITTWYGKDENSRICDPHDKTRIFSWLICQSHDDKGNVIVYGYKREDSERIFEDTLGQALAKSHERNRTAESRAAQCYLKRIRYGNRSPYFPVLKSDASWPTPPGVNAEDGSEHWLFEVVFDYDDGHYTEDRPDAEGRIIAHPVYSPPATAKWPTRIDPFSTYRAGFEVRTYRLCQRVLMFHHFPNELGTPDCLVRSTDFTYSYENDPTDARNPIYSFLESVSQCGYLRQGQGANYLKKSLPPVKFTYTQPTVQDVVEEVDPESLENLPIGLDGAAYQWTDLHGEGIPGILSEQAGAWLYKRNWSPLPEKLQDGSEVVRAKFSALETVALKPNVALSSGAQFMDLAGDGQPDLVMLDGPMTGLYEHDEAEGWGPFRPFTSRLNRDMRDPNLRFVDLDGDGHADVLITEDEALVWHASLAEEGFGEARRVAQALDEEKGPRLVFNDGTQSIYLADLSGDGLTDLVRIRNGEVCYWPNLGYGNFGAKVTMDHAPWFDNPDQFDHKRIRLADIDGSGTTDIMYLHRDGVRLYFNQSGNSWSQPRIVDVFPRIDEVASIVPTDLLGNGTACLVWSSPLPGDARRPMRYVNLMGGQKPHLLRKTRNNLGAETVVEYAPSIKFYLQDNRDGKPWITKLPFPVHVVERVETYDHISKNRFITRYAYHHGYFDGEEREFRGFGMVEQWDTEEFAVLTANATLSADNIDKASHVPPVHTKTWFHTGAYVSRDHVSDFYAGLLDATDQGEYFREPRLNDDQARELLLPDTVLPDGLTLDEEREACRALKGSMLRQEVYADDKSDKAKYPYTVTEQNYTIRPLQRRGDNRHAVFFAHANEALSYHYERNPADPRIQHALTLEVDDYGNVLKQAAIGYGRRRQIRVVDAQGNVQVVSNPGLAALDATDQAKQTTALLTYSENRVTNAVELPDVHRTPLPCESVTYELTGYRPTGAAGRYQASDIVEPDPDPAAPGRLHHKVTDQVAYEAAATGNPCRRPIEWLRTLYRRDDLNGLLPLRELHALALPGESYKLACTPGLLNTVFQRPGQRQAAEPLLPDPAAVLGGQAGDQGGYVNLDGDGNWWIPSGRSFFTDNPDHDAATEFNQAWQHFFLPRRYRDPFGHDAIVDFDTHDLLVRETRDALGNSMTVNVNDYRVLQPRLVSDPNRNRAEVAFDTLGMVVGTALMGKPQPAPVEGDSLEGFIGEVTPAQRDQFMTEPRKAIPNTRESEATPIVHELLGKATTRIVYDLERFMRLGKPPVAATIARETHVSDVQQNEKGTLQVSFSYSDGFGREIQKKIQAEMGKVPQRDGQGKIIVGQDGQPVMAPNDVAPRWVGSGWTIFNNKGKPVRQFEPFFSDTHKLDLDAKIGVSPVLFYDPAERVVATLHPNHTYEKVRFDPWQQTTWDVNDTVATFDLANRTANALDPAADHDVGGFFQRLPGTDYLPTWYDLRTDSAKALAEWPDRDPQGNAMPGNAKRRATEKTAAERAATHANTPTTAHFDALGRPFLTVVRNRVVCFGHDLDGTEERFATRVELDIEGNQRAVRDERKLPVNHLPTGAVEQRIVMRYAYDMLGNRIHQLSMEAGARWMLNDVAGKPIRAWDSRGHNFTTKYDELRRPVEQTVQGTFSDPDPFKPNSDPRTLGRDIVVDMIEYGEGIANAEDLNLRTRIYRHFDSAGVATNAGLDPSGSSIKAYDFKGNLLRSTRRLVSDYRTIPDWLLDPQLDTESFEGSTRYDALNRPIQSVAPHSSLGRGKFNIIQPVFNEANLLERVDVWLDRATEPGVLLTPASEAPSPVGVANIDYDAKGQRTRIDYKTRDATVIRTTYDYDRKTFRLTHLYTRRGVDPKTANGVAFTDDCDNPTPPPLTIAAPNKPPQGKACGLQNLHYTYDPAGNITHIRDDAQQTIYFKNKRVEPSNDYSYDAIYRLIQATGREHLGQLGGAPIPHSHNDAGRVGLVSADVAGRFAPSDGNAMGTCIERYVYDAVGNFLQMQHRGTDPVHSGWTRRYTYGEASLTEPGKLSNRLSRTQVGNGVASAPEDYLHDVHGNMTHMPHLHTMDWDFK